MPTRITMGACHEFRPAYYFFDGEGKLRGFAAGERGLDLLKSTLDRVMAQAEPTLAS
ncbi:MAG: hypothetical protein ABI923_04250 [bacterium]